MKTLLAAGAAIGLALSAAPAPAVAQTTGMQMSAQQKTMYDGWPAERKAAYDAWPMEAKTYFWTLNDQQKRGWWVLNDEQRVRIVGMTPQQRTAAWTSIMNQMSGSAPATAAAGTQGNMAATTSARTGPAASGNMRFVSNAVVQNVATDQVQGEPPVCERGQTDNCINAWEAGKRGRGVTKPLDRWPGQPASQRD